MERTKIVTLTVTSRFVFLLIISLSVLPDKLIAQSYDWRSNIDKLVQMADSLSNKTQKTFYSQRYLKNDLPIKETWHYTLHNGKVLIFQLRYQLDATEFTEVYYVNKGSLVCMEQFESPYNLADDEIHHAQLYYFVGSEMKQYVTYGRSKQTPNYISSIECLEKFQKRYNELLRNMKHTPNMGLD